jgi:hypothetical protein
MNSISAAVKSTGHRKEGKRGTTPSYDLDYNVGHARDSLGRGERLRERDHPKCDRLGGDWVMMGSRGRGRGDVPEGEAGHHVAAAGTKISRGQTGTDGRYWALQPSRSWDEPGFVASSLSLAEAEVAVLSHAWQMTKLF